MGLPININELIHAQVVESERIEFKRGWNKEAVLHTLCAFANDFHNWGGGYVIIGIAEDNGVPVLPPVWLEITQIDKIQKELLEICNHALRPAYTPIAHPVVYQEKHILINWVPGGQHRPYKAKKFLTSECKEYLQNMFLQEQVIKVPNQAEAIRYFNYPFTAIEEAVVNAVYHRDYQLREPVEITVFTDRIEILNFPGPDRSIKYDDLQRGQVVSRRYRNRRIGEFLKELKLTEGRSTGLPKIKRAMAQNGSPEAIFDTNPEHDYFLTTLTIHPGFLIQPKNNYLGVQDGDQISTKDAKYLNSPAKNSSDISSNRILALIKKAKV